MPERAPCSPPPPPVNRSGHPLFDAVYDGMEAAATLTSPGVIADVRLRNSLAVQLPKGAALPAVVGTAYRWNVTPPVLLFGAPVASCPAGGTIQLNAIAWVLCLGLQRMSIYAWYGAVCDDVMPLQSALRKYQRSERGGAGKSRVGEGKRHRYRWTAAPDVVLFDSALAIAPVSGCQSHLKRWSPPWRVRGCRF